MKKKYYYEDNGGTILSSYKEVKYYAYLPDGNGELKAYKIFIVQEFKWS